MSTVKAILIELDGKETRLTVDEAKALYAALGELVGAKPVQIERVVERSPYWYHSPMFNRTYTSAPDSKPFEITCNANLSDRLSMAVIGGGSGS